eukprot:PLAT5597.1.p1 GENE.PLAT5597.1~~PLAT5597.1.p1  ORF type:complete len:140 (+),score=27.24 PLAT5597.1:27-422(+)
MGESAHGCSTLYPRLGRTQVPAITVFEHTGMRHARRTTGDRDGARRPSVCSLAAGHLALESHPAQLPLAHADQGGRSGHGADEGDGDASGHEVRRRAGGLVALDGGSVRAAHGSSSHSSSVHEDQGDDEQD